MRKFYIVIILFLLPLFMFMGGVEYTVRQIPNYYSYKYDWMELNAEEVETLVLGNSHSLNGVIPRYLGKNTFNLALPGQTLKYDAYLFFRWSNRYQNLKMVIWTISDFSFFIDHAEWIGETYGKIYLKSPFHSDFSRYNIEMLEFKPLHSKIYHWFTSNEDYDTERGWQPLYLKDKDQSIWKYKIDQNNRPKLNTNESLDNIASNYVLVSDVIKYCQNRNIRIALISTPYYNDYNNALNKMKRVIMSELIGNLQDEYDVSYMNYQQDNRFCADDFFDPTHLSEIGAEKFTVILKNDLQN